MTKTKSKQIKQLKYLLLVPVLASMLFYTSCTENQKELVPQKMNSKVFIGGKEVAGSKERNRESYFDFYVGKEYPKGKELRVEDLSNEEKLEVEEFKNRDLESKFYESSKIILLPNGRKAIALKFDFKNWKNKKMVRATNVSDTEDVSFMIIEKVPVFPGCTGTNLEKKKCFSKSVQKYFLANFNKNLPNSVGLSPGKKKVYIGFKIDKEGNVVNVQVRAPHPDIKKEVKRIMQMLPKMIPGEQRGEKIGVKYSIPFAIIVE